MKEQKAGKSFAEAADNFKNLVYEKADSLQDVAKTLNTKLDRTDWITRPMAQQIGRNNAKFVQAVFAPEAIQSKRNTEDIEIAPNTLIAARVLEHKPAAPRAYAEVKPQIERQLRQREASEAAMKAGKDKLAQLEQGKSADLSWGKTQMISRQEHGPEIGPEAIKLIFTANAAKLPSYVGAPNQAGGYSVYKISKVSTPPTNDEAKIKSATSRISEQVARESLTAYVAELKKKADVKVKQENLEKK